MSKRKYFPKFIYFFLVVLFVYNSFGYLFLYFPVKSIIKQMVQESIKEKKIDREELSVLVFGLSDLVENKYSFTWIKPDKEFRYNGKMYDVENKEVKGDSIYYSCYYDHKENILEEIFTLQFNDHKKDKTHSSLQRIVLMGLFSEEINNINTKLDHPKITSIPLQKTEAGLLTNVIDVPTPPPRSIA